jgi:hypothetical protein
LKKMRKNKEKFLCNEQKEHLLRTKGWTPQANLNNNLGKQPNHNTKKKIMPTHHHQRFQVSLNVCLPINLNVEAHGLS